MEKSINSFASESVTIKNLTVSGKKDAGNGKINFKTPVLNVSDVVIENGCTVYNVFEGSQVYNKDFYNKEVTLSGITCDNISLKHNVLNVYTPNDDAVITIKDSVFNLNVVTSNVMRVANYTNAKNVTINFENVEWNYENCALASTPEHEDWAWAGLLLYQPAGKDSATTGNLEAISTWTINITNCKYNGEKVTENNFGSHSQAVYAYNINKSGEISNPELIFNIVIK